VGGPAPPLPHSQVSLGSVDVKSTSTVQSSTVASATGPDSSVLVAVLISVGNSNHLVPLRTSQIVCAIEWIGSSRYRRVLFPALTSTSPGGSSTRNGGLMILKSAAPFFAPVQISTAVPASSSCTSRRVTATVELPKVKMACPSAFLAG